MDDNESKSGWDTLVQDLGADPLPEASRRHQPASTEAPPKSNPDESAKSRATPQPAPSDWGGLADSLGIEVAEPELPAEKSRTESPIESTGSSTKSFEAQDDRSADGDTDTVDELPPLLSEIDQAMSESAWENDDEADGDEEGDESGISGEVARDAFEALFSTDSVETDAPISDRQTDQMSLEFPESSQSESEIAQEGEDRPKKRRPRRRRRGSGQSSDAQARANDQTPGEEPSSSGEDLEGEGLEERVDQDRDQDEKPRRRRSRRRPSRADSDDALATPNESDSTSALNDDADDSDDDDADDADDDDADSTEEPRTAAKTRAGHRNLPTWSEAIGVIVDANLQQRNKTPSKPSSPRGRGRGGRRRSKKTS